MLPASLPLCRQRHETGLGLCLAFAHGGGDLCHHPERFRPRHLLHYGRELNAMDQVIAIMFVIIAIGLLADKVLFSPWERYLHRRWGTARN